MSEPASADAGFRSSLVRHAAGAVGLVVLAAVLFWAIGSVGGDDGEVPTAAESPDTDGPEDVDEPTGIEDEGDDADKDGAADTDDADERDGEAEADDPADGAADDDADDADDADADDADDADADAGSAEDEDAGDEPATPRIDPATISVQVLDGYQQDGGAAADTVQQQLTDEGYDVVARNPALRYDQTTVLWTAGFEDEARQVAADIGAAEVREQPGTLSDSVAVHVVVGADRG